jgi:hypothetical protein
MSALIHHESVKNPNALRSASSSTRLLNIFDEPDFPVAEISLSLKLIINYSVAFRHTSNLVRLPFKTPLAKFELPILCSELSQNSVISSPSKELTDTACSNYLDSPRYLR